MSPQSIMATGNDNDNNNVEHTDSVEYLKSLKAIRQRSRQIFDIGLDGGLGCFDIDMSKMPTAVEMILGLIRRDYGSIEKDLLLKTIESIPPHGRWRHFGDKNITNLIEKLEKVDGLNSDEITMSILDLFTVAVLLDAGAGDSWSYKDNASGKIFNRSEGLAIASLRMFEKGEFSSDNKSPRVDSTKLVQLTVEQLVDGFQVTKENPLLGVEGRVGVLQRLGKAVSEQSEFFPTERPGSMFQYLCKCAKSTVTNNTAGSSLIVNVDSLWEIIINGLQSIWPDSRTKFKGIALGDVWTCDALGTEKMVPFHKLSQWLAYSLMEPLEKLGGIHFERVEKMTGLAEYRNGGFFVDLGILKLKESSLNKGLFLARQNDQKASEPTFYPHDQEVIEWRALTIILIDQLADQLRTRLDLSAKQLPLAKLLEAGTWKAGRELAKQYRPLTSSPPISIISDGTLF